jgi:broad specificity phosphatase PhoE
VSLKLKTQCPSLNLILLRHGNTFEAGQPAVWLGPREDPGLTARGLAQIERAAEAILLRGEPSTIYSGPLARTLESAHVVKRYCRSSVEICIDPRLTELDYGQWTGLTNAEIEQRYGTHALRRWLSHGEWPKDCGWKPGPAQAEAEMRSFVNDALARGYADMSRPLLVVSTNGRLRYFLKLVQGGYEMLAAAGRLPIATGHLARLPCEDGKWSVAAWDLDPETKS